MKPRDELIEVMATAAEPLLPGAYFSTCEKVASAMLAALLVELPDADFSQTSIDDINYRKLLAMKKPGDDNGMQVL